MQQELLMFLGVAGTESEIRIANVVGLETRLADIFRHAIARVHGPLI